MNKTVSAGGVVIGPDNKIVVVNQNGNSWSLPKGHIDLGEDELSAAKREIYEETGIELENLQVIKKLGTYERPKIGLDGRDDLSETKIIHIYLFQTSQATLSPLDPANPEARWVEKEKVIELLTHDKDKKFFEKILKEI
ncbi:NUDIX domain-containing protein [Candidatus Kuenenbacteria bacterium]|nr:NUDIX domain-containing protein [Candidatus Kuenenbacteria bacterium]